MRFKAEKIRRAANVNNYSSNDEVLLTHDGSMLNCGSLEASTFSSVDGTEEISDQKLNYPLSWTMGETENSASKKLEHIPCRQAETQVVVKDYYKYIDNALESLISTKLIEFRPSGGTKENELIASAAQEVNVTDDYDVQLGSISFEVRKVLCVKSVVQYQFVTLNF